MDQRNTRQREAILQQLQGRTDHPTAETLYAELKPQYPHMSLGTVYRNLAVLSENGQILHIQFENGADHYDGDTMRHYHMVCERCGGVCDVPNPITGLKQVKKFKGEIRSIRLHFTGICPACKQREASTDHPQGSE